MSEVGRSLQHYSDLEHRNVRLSLFDRINPVKIVDKACRNDNESDIKKVLNTLVIKPGRSFKGADMFFRKIYLRITCLIRTIRIKRSQIK